MTSVKTTISVDAKLFTQIDGLAREMNVSRSRLIAGALEEYLRRRENRRITDQFNRVVREIPRDAEEEQFRSAAKRSFRRIVAEE